MITRLVELRKAVLDSWTLTYQRETGYARLMERAADKLRTFFTRHPSGGHPKEVEVEVGGVTYRIFEPVPEATSWIPFAVLLEQLEAAVREDERE